MEISALETAIRDIPLNTQSRQEYNQALMTIQTEAANKKRELEIARKAFESNYNSEKDNMKMRLSDLKMRQNELMKLIGSFQQPSV
jgi:septal ring factor EnvC (AmiA/AmiB activator)